MSKRRKAPLREDRHVRQLLSVMKANHVDARDLVSILNYVNAMEKQLDSAVMELQSMRRELSEMRESRENPAATTLRNAVYAMETKISEACEL